MKIKSWNVNGIRSVAKKGFEQWFADVKADVVCLQEIKATPEQLDEFLAGCAATVMAGGHTHIQMVRQHRGTLLCNPGSVGMPFREFVNGRAPTLMPHAEYASVEADASGQPIVTLRRVAIDRQAVHRAVVSTTNPLRDMLLTQT